MVCKEDTRMYTGSGGTSPRPVESFLCYLHLSLQQGLQTIERETSSQVSVDWGCCVFSWSRRIVCACGIFQKGSPPRDPASPFIVLRGRAGYSRDNKAEKGGKREKKGGYGEKETRALGSSSSFPSLARAPHFLEAVIQSVRLRKSIYGIECLKMSALVIDCNKK
jgi:hypothetical protein